MSTYYKGTIVSATKKVSNKEAEYVLGLLSSLNSADYGRSEFSSYSYDDFCKLNSDVIRLKRTYFDFKTDIFYEDDRVLAYFKELYLEKRRCAMLNQAFGWQECNDEKVIDFMNAASNRINLSFDKAYKKIIYEKVQDAEGNVYAREIHTGLCFPLYNKKMESKNYYFIIERNNNIVALIGINLIVPNTDKCECIVTDEKVVDYNEVRAYNEQFSNGLFAKHKDAAFRKELDTLYNKNVFSKEPEFKTKEEKEKAEKQQQNKETLMMENIEYMLQKLQAVDEELYNAYQGKYNEIIFGDFTCMNLASLEGELEFHLMMGKTSAEDITKYLESLKIEYLEKVLTGKEMSKDLTIKDIDRFEDIVLKVKDKYSLVTQRRVLKDLAFLYLLEVYENKDLISDYDFSDSYFASNLKTIVIIVKSLINLGVIENNISIEINDEISLENVLDIISKIKFNKTKEDINRLIMSI